MADPDSWSVSNSHSTDKRWPIPSGYLPLLLFLLIWRNEFILKPARERGGKGTRGQRHSRIFPVNSTNMLRMKRIRKERVWRRRQKYPGLRAAFGELTVLRSWVAWTRWGGRGWLGPEQERNNRKLPHWAGEQAWSGAWELTSCRGFVWGYGSVGRVGAPE